MRFSNSLARIGINSGALDLELEIIHLQISKSIASRQKKEHRLLKDIESTLSKYKASDLITTRQMREETRMEIIESKLAQYTDPSEFISPEQRKENTWIGTIDTFLVSEPSRPCCWNIKILSTKPKDSLAS